MMDLEMAEERAENFWTGSLSGKEVKVVIEELPGATMIYWNDTGGVTGYGGFMYEELSWLSLRLNFSMMMVPNRTLEFGALVDGKWTGMIGQLQRKEVDIACNGFNGVGYEVMDHAAYVVTMAYGILVPFPVPRTLHYSHVTIFSLNVWIWLLFSTMACISFIWLFYFFYRKYFQDININEDYSVLANLSDITVNIFANLTNHNGRHLPSNNRQSIKIMVFIWCLTTFVVVNVYSSCLTSYLSLIFERPDINTFSDLATNQNYQLTTVETTLADIILLDAKSGTMGEIGDKLRKCPQGVCRKKTFEDSLNKVLEDNFAAILPSDLAQYYMRTSISNGKCQLTMAQEAMASNNYFMGVQKNSSFAMELNKESYWYHSFGLKEYWQKKMDPDAPQCLLKYNSMGESVKIVDKARLKLEQFYAAFIVLFVGYALSLIQFIRELFIRKFM